MINGKYVSINTIMEGVFRDYGFTHEVDWVDIVEWVGEALDLIGAPKQYISKVTDGNESLFHPCQITISNFRGELPCDIYKVQQVREWYNKAPMLYATNTYHTGLEKNITVEDTTKSFTSFGTITFASDLIENQTSGSANSTDLTYTFNDNYIFTNFKEGAVEMAYLAYPTDAEGLPLIPDDVAYIKGVKAYIGERIAFKLWLQDKLRGDKYNKINQDRDWYIGKAKTSGLMPSTLDEFESWKNMTLRLLPVINRQRESFEFLPQQEQRKNKNSF